MGKNDLEFDSVHLKLTYSLFATNLGFEVDAVGVRKDLEYQKFEGQSMIQLRGGLFEGAAFNLADI